MRPFPNEPTNRQIDKNRQKPAVGFFHRTDCSSSVSPAENGPTETYSLPSVNPKMIGRSDEKIRPLVFGQYKGSKGLLEFALVPTF